MLNVGGDAHRNMIWSRTHTHALRQDKNYAYQLYIIFARINMHMNKASERIREKNKITTDYITTYNHKVNQILTATN